MKKKVFITGLKSIIGKEVFRYLSQGAQNKILIGQRNNPQLPKQDAEYRYFDFNDSTTYNEALVGVHTLFLVIPRHVKHIEQSYSLLLEECKNAGVQQIIFSSIFRGKYSSFLPHHVVEKLIQKSSIDSVIVQPTYFMQNLTTFFKKEIKEDRKIAIPHLQRKFNWIDARNAGDAIVHIMNKFDQYKNQTIPLMGNENKNFMEVTAKLTASLPEDVVYTATYREFLSSLKKKGLKNIEIFVLIVFIITERLDSKYKIESNYENITGKKPTRLIEFIMRHLPDLEPHNA